MASSSYDTEEDQFDGNYLLCCRLFHITKGILTRLFYFWTAAKFISCYYFVACLLISGVNFLLFGFDHMWFSVVCVCATIYSICTVYGVHLEKKFFLIPFILIQGLLTAIIFICTIVFAVSGIATNAIQKLHVESKHLRDLYHHCTLDPDDEITRTVVAWSVLVTLLVMLWTFSLAWWVVYSTYRIYSKRHTINRLQYYQGVSSSERF